MQRFRSDAIAPQHATLLMIAPITLHADELALPRQHRQLSFQPFTKRRAIKWSMDSLPGPFAMMTRKQTAHVPCVGQASG